MLEHSRLAELSEAVADGRAVDWDSAAGSAATEDEREMVASFQGLAAIGGFFSHLTLNPAGLRRARPLLAPGTHWGPLRVIEHAGRGRFGDVYRAWDPALAREVALKLVSSGDAPLDEQVIDEGRLMARVRHPNVVTIHGAQRIDFVTGLWMEFVEGRTLESELSERGPFPSGELVEVGIQLCRALSAVHAAGLVHRDVKASNVLRDRDGRVLLGDFGTGGELERDDASRAGLVGTPAYLAPEIFRREPATPQSDVYSLGVLLFHLATGQYPFPNGPLRALREAHANDTPASLADLRPDIPATLADVVTRALDADPARRYQTAEAMARALEAQQAAGSPRYSKWVAAAVAAVAVTGAWLVWQQSRVPFTFTERDAVLVAAFDNRTGDPEFDGTIETALRLELDDLRQVSVVGQERIEDTLALMRKPLDTPVGAAVGMELARRDGQIQAVVTGAAERVRETYRLSAEVLNAADGAVAVRVFEVAASRDDVLPAVARLAAGIGDRLVGAVASLQDPAPLPRVRTSSLRALQLYAEALRDLPIDIDGDHAEAERLARLAIEEDPEFTLAYVALAQAIYQQGTQRWNEALRYAELAVAKSEGGPPAERLQAESELESYRAETSRQDPAARSRHRQRAVELALALYEAQPDSAWAVSKLLRAAPRLPPDRRLQLARSLVEQRPNSIAAWGQAASVAAQEQAFDLARERAARARALFDLPARESSGTDGILDVLLIHYEDAWNRNDIEAAVAVAEEIDALRRGMSDRARSTYAEATMWIHLALGQFDRAEALAAEAAGSFRTLRTLSVLSRREDPTRLRAYMEQQPPDLREPGGWAYIPAYIDDGQLEIARREIEALRPRQTPQWMANLDAHLARAEGRPDLAVSILEPFASPAPPAHLPDHGNWLGANGHLGRALFEAGRIADATVVLERIFSVRRELRRPWFRSQYGWLEARDVLAQSYRRMGRLAEADAVDAELLTLLRFADNDHPIKRRLDAEAR